MPQVSVIMPVYNAAYFVAESIKSVLQQSIGDLELIVVDDGSHDNSVQVIEGISDSRIKLLRQPNQGVSSARNKGLHEASGEFIAFLDADDTWDPHFLEQMIVPLKQFPKVALSYCGWQNVGLVGGRSEPFLPPEYETPTKCRQLLKNCPWPIHAALTRRLLIEKVNGFPESYEFAEDYLLWLRIAMTAPIFRVPQILSFYRFHDGQASRNKSRVLINARRAKLEFLGQNLAINEKLGNELVRELTDGELLICG